MPCASGVTAFLSVCRSEVMDLSQSVAPITEERASRTLYRIGLLSRLRERVLPHPSLEERLLLVQPSSELPRWWHAPQHDRELLLGASRHGVSRTELSIFRDPDFSFLQAHLDFMQGQARPASRSPTPSLHGLQQEDGEGAGVKTEEQEAAAEARLLGEVSMSTGSPGRVDSPSMFLAQPDGAVGKGRGCWGWKKNRGRGRRGGGHHTARAVEGGPSDSESESDSDSTSSRRSGSSDESGDSEGDQERGERAGAPGKCGMSQSPAGTEALALSQAPRSCATSTKRTVSSP